MKVFYALLIVVFLALQRMPALGVEPAMLFTDGGGFLLPIKAGQQVSPEHIYRVIPIPFSGNKFSYWQAVHVQIFWPGVYRGKTINLSKIQHSITPLSTTISNPMLEYQPSYPQYQLFPYYLTIINFDGWEAHFIPAKPTVRNAIVPARR